MTEIATGLVSTDDVLEDEQVIDMSPDFHVLDPDESQFTTYVMDTAKRGCTREVINWLEDEYAPRLTTVTTNFASTGTTVDILVTTGQGAYCKVGNMLKNMRTGEGFWVTDVVVDTVSTVRSIGRIAGTSGLVGDQILICGSAFAQGADFPSTSVVKRVLGFNYTQIFRDGWNFSRTETKIKEFGGSNPAKEQAKKFVEHKRGIEYNGFWGGRQQITDPDTGEPVGFAGGLDDFIVSVRRDVNGTLTADYLDDFLKDALEHGSKNKVFYVAPLLALQISKFNRSGQGSQWRPSNERMHGVKVDAFVSGAYGYEIPVIVKRDWNSFTTTDKQYGGWGFLADHDYISARPLTDSDTQLLLNREPRGRDARAGEYLTEMTWEIGWEQVHAILFGVV
jgi:hypothetical protein